MKDSILIGLLQNTAILLSFSMLYNHVLMQHRLSSKIWFKSVVGIIIGAIGIVLMLTPWTLVPGVVFDMRSVLLAITGLFFGIIPTVVASLILVAFRTYLGGAGVFMGVAVIISSAGIGLFWRHLRSFWVVKNHWLELIFLGVIVHLVMILSTVFLPPDLCLKTIKSIAIPVVFVYPISTVLLGFLLYRRLVDYNTKLVLRHTEDKYSSLYESMTDAYVRLNLKGKIVEANAAFIQLVGYSLKELKPLAYRNLTPLKWHEYEQKIVDEFLLKQGSSNLYEKEYIHKDGHIFPVELRSFLLKDDQNKPTGIWAIVRDVSHRKRIEQQLTASVKMAEDNNRLKSIFLANMSHEIRTLMNAILGFSDLLCADNLSDTKRLQYANIIQQSGVRLMSVVDNIMDISKIEAGQLPINKSRFSMNELLHDSYNMFNNTINWQDRPELTFKVNISEQYNEIIVFSDRYRVRQVLDNLLGNAFKYTKKGVIEIGCLIDKDNDKQSVVSYVSDTGIGIPQDKRELIFETFRQVEEIGFYEGAGLGLSIAKGIVSLLGGEIWFKSEFNAGSTFYYTIPIE